VIRGKEISTSVERLRFSVGCGDFSHLLGVPNLMRCDHLEPFAEVEGAQKGMGHVIFS